MSNDCGCDPGGCATVQPTTDPEVEKLLEQEALAQRLEKIRHKILVLSGKGGVGKSTVAANLAVSLARQGFRTGLLDIDLHGPSIPKLLRLEGGTMPSSDGRTMEPAVYGEGLKVVSIGFLLRDASDAVIWRGPLKMGVIKQFIKDVNWGELDYLVVDSPPGTGDEPLSICQLIADADGAVVVTTPQDVAIVDVRKCITFCRQLQMPVLGVVENMSGFACPHCRQRTDLFGQGGGEAMAVEMGVPFLGRIPIDAAVVESGDAGRPFVHHGADGPAARALGDIIGALRERLERGECHAT